MNIEEKAKSIKQSPEWKMIILERYIRFPSSVKFLFEGCGHEF